MGRGYEVESCKDPDEKYLNKENIIQTYWPFVYKDKMPNLEWIKSTCVDVNCKKSSNYLYSCKYDNS